MFSPGSVGVSEGTHNGCLLFVLVSQKRGGIP